MLHGYGMNERTYGERLREARRRAGYKKQQALGDMIGRSDRTVRSWETNHTEPDDADKALLRELLGDFDTEGDPVESAVRSSRLTEDRQYAVISTYKRHLREQDEGEVKGA